MIDEQKEEEKKLGGAAEVEWAHQMKSFAWPANFQLYLFTSDWWRLQGPLHSFLLAGLL